VQSTASATRGSTIYPGSTKEERRLKSVVKSCTPETGPGTSSDATSMLELKQPAMSKAKTSHASLQRQHKGAAVVQALNWPAQDRHFVDALAWSTHSIVLTYPSVFRRLVLGKDLPASRRMIIGCVSILSTS